MQTSKLYFLIILCLALSAFGCTVNKSATPAYNDFPGEPADSLVAYLERTRCFGVCPYYSIHIYRSGYVIYLGIDHVTNIGRFYTYLSKEQLKQIGEKAEALGYFELDDEYRNPYLTDFPTIYSEVRFRGKRKKITHYHSEPPQNLVEMENYIDAIFNENTNWQVHPDQNFKD